MKIDLRPIVAKLTEKSLVGRIRLTGALILFYLLSFPLSYVSLLLDQIAKLTTETFGEYVIVLKWVWLGDYFMGEDTSGWTEVFLHALLQWGTPVILALPVWCLIGILFFHSGRPEPSRLLNKD